MKYKIGEKLPITIEGFMGIEIPTNAVISDIKYEVHADLGNGNTATMILNEQELLKRIIIT